MSVTVDHEPLEADHLGLQTIGHVLLHLQKSNRLVVQVLIDGQEPEAGQLSTWRQSRLDGHTIFIETADPRGLALEVLGQVEIELKGTDQIKTAAAELLQQGQPEKALAQLSSAVRTWQNAQESLSKVAELLRIDLGAVKVGDRPLTELLAGFSCQLRQIKGYLEQRDYVGLGDVLMYEMGDTTKNWAAAIGAMGEMIRSLR